MEPALHGHLRGNVRGKDVRRHGRRRCPPSSASLSSSASSSFSDASSFSIHPSEDWVCQLCSNINSLHRDACFRCGVPFQWAHHPHSCMLQAMEVPHEWAKEEIVHALRQAVGGTSPASGDRRTEGEEEYLEVVGGAWEEEIQSVSLNSNVVSQETEGQMDGASGVVHRNGTKKQWNAPKDIAVANAMDHTPSFATDATTVSSFVFFFSSPQIALKALLRCRCQLKLVSPQRRFPLEKGEDSRLEVGASPLSHTSPSPSSSSPASSSMGRTTDDPHPSIAQTVSLCFASSSLRRMATEKSYPLLTGTTSVGGPSSCAPSTSPIPTVTHTTGKHPLTSLATAAGPGGDASPSSRTLLPAALEHSTWIAPTSFNRSETEEAYLLLLEAHWDQLSVAQKAFYDRTIPLVLARKASTAPPAENLPSSVCASSTPLSAAMGGVWSTTHSGTMTSFPSSTAWPSPTASSFDGSQRPTSDTRSPTSAFPPHETPHAAPIQTVADPITASLLAKAREKMTKRKAAAAKEASSPSLMGEASGFPEPSSSLLSTTASLAPTTTPATGMLSSSSAAPAASSFLHSAIPSTFSRMDTSSSLPNPSSSTVPPADSHTHKKKECTSTNNASHYPLSGTSATIPFFTSPHTFNGGSSGVLEAASVQALSCHSGFTFPPFPASSSSCSSFFQKNLVPCENEDGTRSSQREPDRCNAEKTDAVFTKSYELSWSVSRRILNSSLV